MTKIRATPTLSPARRADAHMRTLTALHESLFAPQFRALERYGEAPAPLPSRADVIAAAKATLAWHTAKETDVAAEIASRRAKGGNPILIDEAARTLAYHSGERERIARDIQDLEAEDLETEAPASRVSAA